MSMLNCRGTRIRGVAFLATWLAGCGGTPGSVPQQADPDPNPPGMVDGPSPPVTQDPNVSLGHAPTVGGTDAGVPAPTDSGEASPPPVRDGSVPPPPPSHGACTSSNEPNDTASTACPLVLDQLVSSQLSADGDTQDFYAIDVFANHTYTLEVIGTGACSAYALSAALDIQSGTEASSVLDAENVGTVRSAREFTPMADGRAIIELDGSCAYTIAVRSSVADGLVQDKDTTEPNNSPSTAYPLVLGTKVISAVTSGDDPNDYFSLEVVAGDTYTIDLIATGSCSSFDLAAGVTLHSPVGTSELVASFNQGIARTATDFTPSSSGTATIQVNGGCAYELTVLGAEPVRDVGGEPNDSPNTAAPLPLHTLVSSAVATNTDPNDFYATDVASGHTYTLELMPRGGCSNFGISSAVSLDAAVGKSQLLPSVYASLQRAAREFTPTANGRAIVQVAGGCAYDIALYESTADHLVQNAALEPNDSPSTATTLEPNQLVSSQLEIDEDPHDYYETAVVAGVTYAIALTGTGSCGSFSLGASVALQSAAGSTSLLTSQSQGATTTQREFTPSADGRAVIEVDGSCAYQLQVIAP